MKCELWLIWKQPQTRRRYKIGTLIYENNSYTFSYGDEVREAIKAGFNNFAGFEDIKEIYRSKNLFPNIASRLPNEKRPDYRALLKSFGLTETSSELEILVATKAKLLTDNYEFVEAFNSQKIEFHIVGTRHCPDIEKCSNKLKENMSLILEIDTENKHDKYAIKVSTLIDNTSYHLGFIPRYYSKEIARLLEQHKNYNAIIEDIIYENVFSDEEIIIKVKVAF